MGLITWIAIAVIVLVGSVTTCNELSLSAIAIAIILDFV